MDVVHLGIELGVFLVLLVFNIKVLKLAFFAPFADVLELNIGHLDGSLVVSVIFKDIVTALLPCDFIIGSIVVLKVVLLHHKCLFQ